MPVPVRGQGSTRKALIAAATAASVIVGAAPSAAVASQASTPAELSAAALPGAAFRDRILPLRPRRTARVAASVDGRGRGGWYEVTSRGSTVKVRVYVSRRYPVWNPAVNRSWAQAFADMPHGSELSKLTVYVAPFSEITNDAVCGAQADSCYDPNDGTMYLSGETPPDGADMKQIAMHEYGHHVAAFRSNIPWDSVNWGPKYWNSAVGVCSLTRQHQMWPTDAWNHYEDHPGEIWAETYRLVASEAEGIPADPWEILSPRWNPAGNPTILGAAARDVTNPWPGQSSSTSQGSLSGTVATVNVSIPLTLDGQVTAKLSVSGSLKATVALRAADGSSLAGASRTSVKATVCSSSSVTAVVTRTSGSGRWTLTIGKP